MTTIIADTTRTRQRVKVTTAQLRVRISELEALLADDDEVIFITQPGPRPKPKSFCCEGHERRHI